jgi:uncharacterized protein (TIGR03118 family)
MGQRFAAFIRFHEVNVKMKTLFYLGLLACVISCQKANNTYGTTPTSPVLPGNFQVFNLVSDTASYMPSFLDTNLVDAWGLAINPKGIFWIAANGTGNAVVYDSTGKTLLGPLGIPFEGVANGSSPSGAIFNATTDFTIPVVGQTALFVYSTENGTLTAWAPGLDTFATVVDNSAKGTVYKGLAWAVNGGANYLYATDFRGGKIDVFDKNFAPVSISFSDPGIPAGFGPFNIVNIGGQLYVTYAKLKGPDDMDDQAGPGNGYVDIFTPAGVLVKRFFSGGVLDSPWGLAQAPAGSGLPFHSILVGNFGDGWINAFDSTGVYLGPLASSGTPIAVPGLWAISFAANVIPGASPSKLYFTAGPDGENQGLFGYIQ